MMSSIEDASRSDAPKAPQAHLEIPSLSGIRAFSWLIVFTSHAVESLGIPGRFGVTVFFFLSGYLITTLLRLEHERTGTISLKAFYMRRVLRIWPPLVLVLTIAIALAALRLSTSDGVLHWDAIASLIFHYTNYFEIARHGSFVDFPPGTEVCWSVAVEEHFYLLFPALFLILHRVIKTVNGRVFALFGICGLVLLWRIWLVYVGHVSTIRIGFATDTRFDSMLFGCILGLWKNPALDVGESRIPEKLWKWAFFPGALVALLIVVALLHGSEAFRYTASFTVQGILMMPLFITAIRWPKWGPMYLLNLKPVKFVGELSYSLYLSHLVILRTLAHFGIAGMRGAALSLLASLAVSWLIYELVEKPSARLRRRLSKAESSPRSRRAVEA